MKLIKWRNSYNTEIESMDSQHKSIIELINKIYNVIRNEESVTSVDEILEEMVQYAEKHLQDEEGFLKTNQFPDLEHHITLHRHYRDNLNELLEKSKKGDAKAMIDTYSFLRQWWTQHIMTEDKKYGEFIKSIEPHQK